MYRQFPKTIKKAQRSNTALCLFLPKTSLSDGGKCVCVCFSLFSDGKEYILNDIKFIIMSFQQLQNHTKKRYTLLVNP